MIIRRLFTNFTRTKLPRTFSPKIMGDKSLSVVRNVNGKSASTLPDRK